LDYLKKLQKKCTKCYQHYQTFEEKQTDVNIAVHMGSQAHKHQFDKLLLFSCDSDLTPAISEIKKIAPHITVQIIIPYLRHANYLTQISDKSSKIQLHHLKKHQFPDKILLNGPKPIYLEKPIEWY
jgi:uncharacterized LabA/DUF88 family protein